MDKCRQDDDYILQGPGFMYAFLVLYIPVSEVNSLINSEFMYGMRILKELYSQVLKKCFVRDKVILPNIDLAPI
jgi:hypothetical protein